MLLDENGWSSDALQLFLYHSCFLYQRATRAVSLPPAVYYAHLAAEKAKKIIQGGTERSLGAVLSRLNELWCAGGPDQGMAFI